MDEKGKRFPKSWKVYDLDENGERIRLPSGNWKNHNAKISTQTYLHGILSTMLPEL